VTEHPTRPENAPDRSMLAGSTDDPVSVAAARDIKDFFAEDGKRRQDLEGFDEIYADIVHYIIRSTHRIWEEGGIGLLYTHYSHNMPLHTTDGTAYGRDAVIAATQRSLAAYPDIRLFGDDVVWAQHGDSYHTSHRITHAGSNLGWSQYGPPTSKKMKRRALAHCVVHENRVVEEWLARDELAVVRSLGLDEFVVAGEIGAADAQARGGPVSTATGEVPRLSGQLPPAEIEETPDGVPPAEHLVRSMFQQVWNWRLLDRITDYYSPTAVIKTSTDLTLNGPVPLRHHILEWLAGFSDLAISVEHVMSNERSGGTVVATRWRIDGTHDGPGRWGYPTVRRVTLLGFSHQLVVNGSIAAEWTVFDEFALLKQIHTPDWALNAPLEPAEEPERESEGPDSDD